MGIDLQHLIDDFRANEVPRSLIFDAVIRKMAELGIEHVAASLPDDLLRDFISWAKSDPANDAPLEDIVWVGQMEPPWLKDFLPGFREWLQKQAAVARSTHH